MDQTVLYHWLIGENNLEFCISSKHKEVSKTLYRSFGNPQEFRQKVLTFFQNEVYLLPEELKKIESIFSLPILQDNIFHFWIDTASQRYKFYISLYENDFKQWLNILTQVRDILGISEKYFLEPNFLKFDCIGCDIRDGRIDLKVYELLQWDMSETLLPKIFQKNRVKEYGVLKNMNERKKYFYRFHSPINISQFSSDFDISAIERYVIQFLEIYIIQKQVKYYCIEWDTKEIYFI